MITEDDLYDEAYEFTEDDLYAMTMESETAARLMPYLCRALDLPYPPRPASRIHRAEVSNPFEETL